MMKPPLDRSLLTSLHRDLPRVLPAFLRSRRWFAAKARAIHAIEIMDIVPLITEVVQGYFVLARIAYVSGSAETYDVPLVRMKDGVQTPNGSQVTPGLTIRDLESHEDVKFLDALSDPDLLDFLLKAIACDMSFAGLAGQLRAVSGRGFHACWNVSEPRLRPVLNQGEQSNNSVMYGERLILKVYRRLEAGINPDLEVGAFLTEKTSFQNIAPVRGHLEYVSTSGEKICLGILQDFVPNQGDAWRFTLVDLSRFHERAKSSHVIATLFRVAHFPALRLREEQLPAESEEIIGEYMDWAALLGRRTAELHLALASAVDEPSFRPEPFSAIEQREVAENAVELLTFTFQMLREHSSTLPEDTRQQAWEILGRENRLRERLRLFAQAKLAAQRIRIHGDYHLGQVLFTGTDFVIIDFEGEPSRTLAERRKKRSPLQDVAGMLRSFHYAAHASIFDDQGISATGAETRLSDWAAFWQKWVSTAFLRKYLEVAGDAVFIPKTEKELHLLLDTFLLDKAVYELSYELNNRPSWLRTPLIGISQLAEEAA
jgi:maltose alpha-D-glucosyltransferase / alpha-amylase